MKEDAKAMERLSGKNLIIRVDASTQIGTGHLMRCLALAQAWKDDGGTVVFITACQSEGLLQRLRDERFDVHLLAGSYPDAKDGEYTKDVLATHPGAWVVLDGYHFDEVYQQRMKQLGHRLLVIDDMAHLKHYYADIVLNQNLHAEQLQYPCESYTRLLLGTRYVLLRREFLAWKDRKREIPEVGRRVLVTLGGADLENHTLKLIQALDKVDVDGLEATVVIGATNPHTDVLEATTRQSHIPIRLVYNAENMPELMAWADAAVSSAGSTVWELLFLGTPTLALILADNQRCIAEQMVRLEVGQSLGWARDVSAKSLARAITLLLKDSSLRASIGKQAQQAVDGRGTQRILKTLQAGKGTREVNVSAARRRQRHNFKVVFMGGAQAGCIGLLTLLAGGCKVSGIVAYDDTVGQLATALRLRTFSSIKQPELEPLLSVSDVLVSVHGREIVPGRLLALPRFGGINVHPCLYAYKGADPVGRLLQDGNTKASVGVHRMTERVDEGEVLVEEFADVTGKYSVDEVYNALYPSYALALLKALGTLATSR